MGPEEISRLTVAYEKPGARIGLVDRDDPLAEMVAKKLLRFGKPACGVLLNSEPKSEMNPDRAQHARGRLVGRRFHCKIAAQGHEIG